MSYTKSVQIPFCLCQLQNLLDLKKRGGERDFADFAMDRDLFSQYMKTALRDYSAGFVHSFGTVDKIHGKATD